jgi:hypothetical protein
VKIKIIYILLCLSLLVSCDYFERKKAKEEAIKREQVRSEQEIAAKREQEARKQNMKNNIAKYVYVKGERLYNDSDYTIDEVVYKYSTYAYTKVIDTLYYIKAHSSEQKFSYGRGKDYEIISVKCRVLGLN